MSTVCAATPVAPAPARSQAKASVRPDYPRYHHPLFDEPDADLRFGATPDDPGGARPDPAVVDRWSWALHYAVHRADRAATPALRDSFLAHADRLRNRIALVNLRLVPHALNRLFGRRVRTRLAGDLDGLGYEVLLRTASRYAPWASRAEFSTYAVRALMSEFGREYARSRRRPSRPVGQSRAHAPDDQATPRTLVDLLPDGPNADPELAAGRNDLRDQVRRALREADLTELQRTLVAELYGLDGHPPTPLREVCARLNGRPALSKPPGETQLRKLRDAALAELRVTLLCLPR